MKPLTRELAQHCLDQYRRQGKETPECAPFYDKFNNRAKEDIGDVYGKMVINHAPLTTWTGLFTWITWPFKFFIYLFDLASVVSGPQDDGLDRSWWFQWQELDLNIMWPAWYMYQLVFTGN